MKSRRRIAFPRLRTAPTSVKAANYSRDLQSAKWGSMIICTANNLEAHEMGSKADITPRPLHALPPKADIHPSD
jgi:hypothetical protein